MSRIPVKRALLSVYDKSGLIALATRLAEAGVELISSGGTAEALEQAGLTVTRVSELTRSPEILGGRVKTLHPAIHGAILARPDLDSDAEDLAAMGIEPIQLVVGNLYPFRETMEMPDATDAEIIEMIDIGGPTMLRAAAKNHAHVGVVTSPEHYDDVAAAVEAGGLDDTLRRELAAEAFFHTASYDAAIAGWIGDHVVIPLRSVADLRYGENPHQEASLFVEEGQSPWWSTAVQHQGKEMSFNNYADTEAAWRLACELEQPSVVVVKHTNPCGAALGEHVHDAFEKAWAGDSQAAFGGVVAVNGELDLSTAEAIAERFVEVVVAKSVEVAALEALSHRKNLRVLSAEAPEREDADLRRIAGGFLYQRRDAIDFENWEVVSERGPTEEELADLRFAWTVCAHTKSNAIVVSNGRQAVGVGAGDQSRVGAAETAVRKAGDRARGGVAASDAFFPFRDGLDTLTEAGVTAVVEPGGSRNDQQVIDAANEKGVALVFTGKRHFKH